MLLMSLYLSFVNKDEFLLLLAPLSTQRHDNDVDLVLASGEQIQQLQGTKVVRQIMEKGQWQALGEYYIMIM